MSNKSYKSRGKGNTGSSRSKAENNKTSYKKDVKLPNNPSWYAKSEQLLNDVASIPFSNVLGNPLPIPVSNEAQACVPGILSLEYSHSLGGGTEATDAPTVAARYLYTFVRHANSGSANYEAPDLYMMIIAWHSANAFITQARRAYGTMMHYLARNRFFAETVVRAMGFDYKDLSGKLPAFRSAINQAAAKLNSIKVPADMPLGMRWNQLASEYYCDGDSTKAQLYIPTCTEFLRFEGYMSETGSSLYSVNIEGPIGVDDFIEYINYMLQPLLEEEDIGIMSGDIQKAFGNNISIVPELSADYISIPIASDEMLMQIHNLIIPGVRYSDPLVARVTQSGGVIRDDYYISTKIGANYEPYMGSYGTTLIIDTTLSDPKPADVMTMTRLIPGAVGTSALNAAETGEIARVLSSGSEVMNGMRIWYKPTTTDWATGFVQDHTVYIRSSFINRRGTSATSIDIADIAHLASFDWAPRLYMGSFATTGAAVDMSMDALPFGDYENYCTVNFDVFKRLNELAILSELATSSHTSI